MTKAGGGFTARVGFRGVRAGQKRWISLISSAGVCAALCRVGRRRRRGRWDGMGIDRGTERGKGKGRMGSRIVRSIDGWKGFA